MPRIFTTLFLILLAPFLIAFLFANRETVTISFDPTSLTDPAMFLDVPLWAGLTGTLLLGFLLGALGMWISTAKLRRRSRAQRRRIAELEREQKQRAAIQEEGLPAPALPALRKA